MTHPEFCAMMNALVEGKKVVLTTRSMLVPAGSEWVLRLDPGGVLVERFDAEYGIWRVFTVLREAFISWRAL